MPPLTENAALEIVRVTACLQHVDVVIRLEKEHIKTSQLLHHILVVAAHIRGDGAAPAVVGDPVPDRLGGVVGDRERMNLQISDRKGIIGLHRMQERFRELSDRGHLLQSVQRPLRSVYRNAVTPGENAEALDMVGMLVRDKNPVDVQGTLFDGIEALLNPFSRDARVNQHGRFRTSRVDAVPAAPARNTAEFHSSVSSAPENDPFLSSSFILRSTALFVSSKEPLLSITTSQRARNRFSGSCCAIVRRIRSAL